VITLFEPALIHEKHWHIFGKNGKMKDYYYSWVEVVLWFVTFVYGPDDEETIAFRGRR